MTHVNKRILIVDDEQDVGLTLKIVLEKYGFTADCFTDPEAALKHFKPDLYDLIILDIKMPKISGFELYDKFKSNDKGIKVIFLTALRELDDYDNQKFNVFPKMGERHFIQKPISNYELLEHVYSIIN